MDGTEFPWISIFPGTFRPLGLGFGQCCWALEQRSGRGWVGWGDGVMGGYRLLSVCFIWGDGDDKLAPFGGGKLHFFCSNSLKML